jgi:hypothetical protein
MMPSAVTTPATTLPPKPAVPSWLIDEIALPEEQVPLTRLCTAIGSTLSDPEPPSAAD